MPDLNSVPQSPHALAHRPAASGRQTSTSMSSNDAAASQAMPPPQAPPAGPATRAARTFSSSSNNINVLPSNQTAVSQSASGGHAAAAPPSPAMASAVATAGGSDVGVGPGPGPLRHPRPMTPAELHQQLEREQEAMVNSLSRDLNYLRDCVSHASSASGELAVEPHPLSGSSFAAPVSRRHNRSSSNTSSRSIPLHTPLASTPSATTRPTNPVAMSRQSSTASRRSQTSSPAPAASAGAAEPSLTYFQQQRIPWSAAAPVSTLHPSPGTGSTEQQLSPGLMAGTSKYEETAWYRSELESAKKENEQLRRRVRDLERMVRERRASDASRTRSESVSTTASVSVAAAAGSTIAGPRDKERTDRPEKERAFMPAPTPSSIAVGVPDEAIKVGESAQSKGGE